ncbi:hypothetical protein PAENIP36_39170 [Paenibacillus sp. P36]
MILIEIEWNENQHASTWSCWFFYEKNGSEYSPINIRQNGSFFILSEHILVISRYQEYVPIADLGREYSPIADKTQIYTFGHSANGQICLKMVGTSHSLK